MLPVRSIPLWLGVLLLVGCAASNIPPEDELVVRAGIVVDRQLVDTGEARSKTRVDTSVHATISSGGGFAIGLGFLLSPFLSSDDVKQAMRYDIDLVDGDRMTVYHDDRGFYPGDCVEIRVHPNQQKYPPILRRNPAAC